MNLQSASFFIGMVESNKVDADGCIGISIPALGGTFQARVVAQMAGDGRGVLFLPEEKDQVLVAPVTGSDVKWVVIGSLWSRNEKPPDVNSNGKNDMKIIKTRGGNMIKLVDTDSHERIEIESKEHISIKADKITLDGDVTITKTLQVGPDAGPKTTIDGNKITGG
jgi:uncharacterized protein involved in type VI secretion and phage assembly